MSVRASKFPPLSTPRYRRFGRFLRLWITVEQRFHALLGRLSHRPVDDCGKRAAGLWHKLFLIGLALFRGNGAPGRDPHGEAFGDQPTLPADLVQS
jgi:hypothetical protein